MTPHPPIRNKTPWPMIAWLAAAIAWLAAAIAVCGAICQGAEPQDWNLFSPEPPAATAPGPEFNLFADVPAECAEPAAFNLFCVSDTDEPSEEQLPYRHCAVKLYADWCPPCKTETVTSWLQKSKWPVLPVNIDADNDQVTDPDCAQYDVEQIPTFIVYQHGREIARMTGKHPTQAFCDQLKAAQ